MKTNVFPCRRSIFLGAALLALGACTAYDRNAPAPLGGQLPLDRNGGGIDVVSGAPQRTFTGEARPAVGSVHAQ